MYKLFDLIRAVQRAMMPYEVAACWEGMTTYHKAWTTQDAREWMACYPVEAACVVWTRRFRVVATRGDVA